MTTTTELNAFRRQVAARALEAVQGESLSVSQFQSGLKAVGVHATVKVTTRDGDCGVEGCRICQKVEVDKLTLSPLAKGTTLHELHRLVFDLVRGLAEEEDWCAYGTAAALRDMGVPAYQDGEEVRLDYDQPVVEVPKLSDVPF